MLHCNNHVIEPFEGFRSKARHRNAGQPTPTSMLHHVDSPDFVDSEAALLEASPQAIALIQALRGCQHPRSGRLMARLRDCQNKEQMEELRADVFQLLALTFGRHEAQRRLNLLQ